MPGKLVLAVGKISGETDRNGDNGWVTLVLGAGAQSSTYLSFWRKVCLEVAHALAGPWLQSAGSLLFPRHSQVKFRPSFPWDPCLAAKPGVMAALSSTLEVPLTSESDTATPRQPRQPPRGRHGVLARQDTALTGGDRASEGTASGGCRCASVTSGCRGARSCTKSGQERPGRPGCLRRALTQALTPPWVGGGIDNLFGHKVEVLLGKKLS